LFSSLEGAELSNFVIDSPKVEGLNSVGALAGYATSSDSKNTTITNVTIRQPQITGQDGVGGLIGTANSKSNGYKVIIDGCTLTCNFASEFGNISAVKNVGGILGKTANSVYDVMIKNCTVNQMNITNTTINGSTAYFAGGIAADMNGIVENPKITNSVISGMGAGGIVGTTSYKAQGIKLTITGAEVTNGTKIIATNTEPLTTVLTPAGGILAMMGNENATYTIKDCIVGTVGATTPDVSVEGYSVAAGGIGSINSVVTAEIQTKQIKATIQNIKTNANVKATRAYVSANQHLYNAASLIGYIGTDFSYISLTNSHAGGIVEGKVRVGGLIGSINFTTSNLANKAFASDCVITATLNIPQNDTNAKRGRVVGDLVTGDGTPFKVNETYTTYAFNNIYYSSYPQSMSNIEKNGENIPKFGVSPINSFTNGIDAKIYNLNNVVYVNGGEILNSVTLSEGQEFVIDNSNSAVKIQTTQPTLTISEGGVLGFTATADGTKNTVFEIASVAPAYDGYVSVSRDYGANTATIIANGTLKGTVDLVFTYTNGLKISLPVRIISVSEKAADYTAVEAAKAKVPADLSIYTNGDAVTAAVEAVVYGLDITKQAEVDAMAKAIEDAIAALELKAADYTAVEAAKAKVPADLTIYANGDAVTAAVEAVVEGLDITKQAEVDAMAQAIEDAIAALELKAADYTAVEAAKAKIPADLTLYTDETVAELNAAVEAVVYGLDITKQAEVDAFAVAIESAIEALDLKEVSEKPQYQMTEEKGRAGEEVEIYVSIQNNPGIISLRNSISYDTTALELVSVENLGLLNGFTNPSVTITSPYILRWSDALAIENNTANGDIVKLTFRIKDNAEVGVYEISVNPIESRNFNGEKIMFEGTTSTITVIDYILGDIDNDGEITDWDAIVFNRYLAGWNVEIEKFEAADIDKDGEITDWDAIILERYLSGWDIVLEK